MILDTGGVSMLAGHRARLQEVRRRGEWPPIVPTAVHRPEGDAALARRTVGQVLDLLVDSSELNEFKRTRISR